MVHGLTCRNSLSSKLSKILYSEDHNFQRWYCYRPHSRHHEHFPLSGQAGVADNRVPHGTTTPSRVDAKVVSKQTNKACSDLFLPNCLSFFLTTTPSVIMAWNSAPARIIMEPEWEWHRGIYHLLGHEKRRWKALQHPNFAGWHW